MGTRSAQLVAAALACPARLACYGGRVTQAAHLSAKIAPEAATDTHPPDSHHPPATATRPPSSAGFFCLNRLAKNIFYIFYFLY
jgi:hypothetical protein